MHAFRLRSRFLTLLLSLPLGAIAAATAHAETTGWESDGGGGPPASIDIVSPADLEHFAAGPVEVPVQVEATLGNLWLPVIRLEVDGMMLPESCSETTSCMFSVPLEDGSHVIEAVLLDDVVVEATDTITVTVGDEACDTGAADGGEGSGGSSAGADTGGGDGLGDGGEPSKGCSVSAGASGSALAGALMLLGLGAFRRRRRR